MKNKLRILWFTGMPVGYTKPGEKLTHGGWMSELLRQMEKSSTVEIGIAFQHTDSLFRRKNGETIYYSLTKKTGALASLKRVLFFRGQENEELQKMLKVVDDFQPDIIHVFGTEGIFGLIAPLTKIPVVIHIQGLLEPYVNAWFPPGYNKYDIKGYRARWNYRVNQYMAEREKRILAQCRFLMGRTEWDKRLSRLYSPDSDYYYCSEMLRNEFYKAPYVHKNKCDEKLRLISIISTPLYKGHDLILKAAKLLKEQLHIDFKWKVYGVWNMHLHEKKWGISAAENNVQLMGRISGDDLRKILQQSDIYVHPSYIDNSPNSVCEAQYLGLPVIACNVGGVSTLITHDFNGILLPANDPFLLAYYIAKLKAEPEFYESLGSNGRSTAFKRHDPDKILADLNGIYNKIIEYE